MWDEKEAFRKIVEANLDAINCLGGKERVQLREYTRLSVLAAVLCVCE